MDKSQLLDVLTTLKMFFETDETQARGLLMNNPQLSYGLFQTLIEQDLIDQDVLQQVAKPKPKIIPITPLVPAYKNPYGPIIDPNNILTTQQYHNTIYGVMQHQSPSLTSQIVQQSSQSFIHMQQPISIQQFYPSVMMPNIGNLCISTTVAPNYHEMPTGLCPINFYTNNTHMKEQDAALILQILNLTQQQIDMFPLEERNRIVALATNITQH
ncbi:7169_t:CDS:2 [Scutellospora calospora]|uniref:7169_t:CDS:1 n=1 Tax=Scutellospora calospora TaxID=85575 RepID=A0ACA9L2C4_9GLOM|nr:7169_t:CDS:2 [Scutellospora calospora]